MNQDTAKNKKKNNTNNEKMTTEKITTEKKANRNANKDFKPPLVEAGGTDLAMEVFDGLEGAEYAEETDRGTCGGEVKVIRLHIRTHSASERLGRPCGEYITLQTGTFGDYGDAEIQDVAEILSRELKRMADGVGLDNGGVLVAGLGNRELTADAVGPLSAARIPATRHLAGYDRQLFDSLGYREISVVAPGVTGQTGIETHEMMRSAVKSTKPVVAVVIDALAARSCDRLGCTVQISDTGICPGSGVGNERSGLNEETLGIPVIAIGVPTIVRSSVLVGDVLVDAGLMDTQGDIPDELSRILEGGKNFFVSPRDCDAVVKQAAAVIAEAVTDAFMYLDTV